MPACVDVCCWVSPASVMLGGSAETVADHAQLQQREVLDLVDGNVPVAERHARVVRATGPRDAARRAAAARRPRHRARRAIRRRLREGNEFLVARAAPFGRGAQIGGRRARSPDGAARPPRGAGGSSARSPSRRPPARHSTDRACGARVRQARTRAPDAASSAARNPGVSRRRSAGRTGKSRLTCFSAHSGKVNTRTFATPSPGSTCET